MEYKASVPFFEDKKTDIAPKHSEADLVLAAYALRTPENIGSIIRLAGNLGVAQLWLVYDEPFQLRRSKIERVAQSSLSHVSYTVMDRAAFLAACQPYSLVALETASGSHNLFKHSLPARCVLLAGSERYGLPNSLLKACHSCVFIPMPGKTASMNVAQATGIAAFEWVRQHQAALMDM